MRLRPAVGALVVVTLGLGCAASRREVRLRGDDGQTIVHAPESGGRPVEIPEAELWGAFAQAGREVVAQVDPLAAAEQTFGVAELSGTYRYYARSGRLVPESLGGGLAELEGSAEKVTRGYLEWCGQTRLGGGDCLRLLTRSKVLSLHGRYVVTLVMSMVDSFGPMLDSLKGLANPNVVAVTLASSAAMYLMLLLLPEPISKAIAIGITVCLIGYLGWDLFGSMVDGWGALTKAADLAQDFGDLRLAARDFGQVLGPRVGEVLLLLMSRSLGKGLAANASSLPRFTEASVQARKLLGVPLSAAMEARAVALGAGGITISIATPAVAMMKATGGGGGSRVRTVPAAKWNPPEGGPGKWDNTKKEAMSDEARQYQSQITGAPPGWVYKIRDVSFDGYKNGVLLDAKDHYKQFLVKGPPAGPKWFFRGFEEFERRALAQVKASGGLRIQWHFAEKEVADYVKSVFAGDTRLKSIEVLHTPRVP